MVTFLIVFPLTQVIVFFAEALEVGFWTAVDWFVVDEAADADGEAVGVGVAVG